MFPVNVVGSDGGLQYGELERAAQSLDKGTAYGVMLGTDTTITEVDGSNAIILVCCSLKTFVVISW